MVFRAGRGHPLKRLGIVSSSAPRDALFLFLRSFFPKHPQEAVARLLFPSSSERQLDSAREELFSSTTAPPRLSGIPRPLYPLTGLLYPSEDPDPRSWRSDTQLAFRLLYLYPGILTSSEATCSTFSTWQISPKLTIQPFPPLSDPPPTQFARALRRCQEFPA